MIEINKTGSQKNIKEKLKTLKKDKSRDDFSGSALSINQSPFFDKLLEITQTEHIKLELNELLEEIDKTGKKFLSDTSLEHLKQYKSLIQTFLDTLIKKMFKVSNITSWRRHKEYTIIEKINDRLEKLTRFVLEKEDQNINLLSTLDEIRGLLVDLYK